MATKQQREIAIKKLSRILKIASKRSISTELFSEIMFLTRFLTIKRIKLIRDNAYTDDFVEEFGNRDFLMNNLNIAIHKDNVVSASTSDFGNDECAIIHFKSRTSRDTIEDRLDGLTLEGILK